MIKVIISRQFYFKFRRFGWKGKHTNFKNVQTLFCYPCTHSIYFNNLEKVHIWKKFSKFHRWHNFITKALALNGKKNLFLKNGSGQELNLGYWFESSNGCTVGYTGLKWLKIILIIWIEYKQIPSYKRIRIWVCTIRVREHHAKTNAWIFMKFYSKVYLDKEHGIGYSNLQYIP